MKKTANAVLGALCASASLAACGGGGGHGYSGTALIGTFRVQAGSCAGATPTGTYFRMIQPGGTLTAGKFFENPDSSCADKSYTPGRPGTDGGLTTGRYQPGPAPAFNASGGATANQIVQPQTFTAIAFSMSTSAKDPQTGRSVPPPAIYDNNGALSGQIEAWSAAWNHQYFNQGSPKPGGALPGLTSAVSGTYDAATHAFVLTWSSQVVGGPFGGFTGYWHLAGTFLPAS